MQRLVISAPFGNYIQPRGATATLGTFTAQARPGRAIAIFRTLRYYPRLRAWVNRIGLRNPGIAYLVKRVAGGSVDVSDKIVSIHGFDDSQWQHLLAEVAQLRPLAVELNMSCPNIGQIDWPADLFARAAAALGGAVIVKLPPVNFQTIADQAVEAGITTFHCCNTLPIAAGGLSGGPLKPVSMQCIRSLGDQSYGQKLSIIGGGGIGTPADIDDYCAIGVKHVAIGTATMNPLLLLSNRPLDVLIAHAQKRLG